MMRKEKRNTTRYPNLTIVKLETAPSHHPSPREEGGGGRAYLLYTARYPDLNDGPTTAPLPMVAYASPSPSPLPPTPHLPLPAR